MSGRHAKGVDLQTGGWDWDWDPPTPASLAIGSNAEIYAICRSDVRPQQPTIYQQIVAFFCVMTLGNDFLTENGQQDLQTSKQIPSKSAGFLWAAFVGWRWPRELNTFGSFTVGCLCLGTLSHPLGICQIYDSVAFSASEGSSSIRQHS